jgi:hypothetical protein
MAVVGRLRKFHFGPSKAGWSLGYVSAVDSQGRTIWIADAHRGDGKRFVVRADEKLTAFLELESAICHARRKRKRIRVKKEKRECEWENEVLSLQLNRTKLIASHCQKFAPGRIFRCDQ